MVESVELLRILDSHHILNILNDADHQTITTGIGADGTGIRVADIMADMTLLDFLLKAADGVGKLLHLAVLLTQKPEHESQSGLAADAGELCELCDRPF